MVEVCAPFTHPTMPRAQLLETRFTEFAVHVCAAARTMPNDTTGKTIAAQLSRSGTAPAANYAEARESASARDYVFKIRICLKELRETMVWIRVAKGSGFRNADYAALEAECNSLTAIVVACMKKAKARM